MKTLFAALVVTSLTVAVPAQAQVEIEEAPGAAGASMEPTYFLSTETARILPGNLNVVSLGVGGPGPFAGNLHIARGMGAGGELRLHAAGLMPTATGAMGYGGGLGYKQRVLILGPWDVALEADAAYYQMPRGTYNFQVGLPATTVLGPGDLTLMPRAVMPDIAIGPMSPGAPNSMYSLQAGYRVPLGQARLLFEGAGAWHVGGYPVYQGKLGLRYAALPNLHLDVHGGIDWWGAGRHLGLAETFGTAGAALRFSL